MNAAVQTLYCRWWVTEADDREQHCVEMMLLRYGGRSSPALPSLGCVLRRRLESTGDCHVSGPDSVVVRRLPAVRYSALCNPYKTHVQRAKVMTSRPYCISNVGKKTQAGRDRTEATDSRPRWGRAGVNCQSLSSTLSTATYWFYWQTRQCFSVVSFQTCWPLAWLHQSFTYLLTYLLTY